MPIRRLLLLALGSAALAASGCGSGHDSAAPGTVEAGGGSSADTVTSAEPTQTQAPAQTQTQAQTETQAQTQPAAGADAQVAATGKKIFASAGCGGCHTLKDAGSNGSAGPNLDDLKPDEATVDRQVTNGGGAMPAFKGQLKPDEIKAVATYVSSVAGK